MLTLADVLRARERIAPYVVETPVSIASVGELPSARLCLKWENHQRTHSFKPRGALNKILSLTTQNMHGGLIAASAGNHGQGVALAAQITGARAHIFVPESTAHVKVSAMQQMGAIVEKVPGSYGDAEAHAIAFAQRLGGTYISPYNDPDVIAGAGTVALEWLAQQPELGRLLIPLGGGGLLAGVGLVTRALWPQVEIVGVQSEASPYLYQQFYVGHMNGVIERPTLTDGLAGSVEPGSMTVPLLSQVCDRVVLVTEEEIARAIAYAFHHLDETIEGSAAVGLAAVLAGKVGTEGRLTGALITGGNIDPEKHAAICRQKNRD
jgi:threonine dehydratase